MDFDPSCLLSVSKDGCRKIAVMHVALNVGISLPSSLWSQMASFLGFLTRDPSLIWNTGLVILVCILGNHIVSSSRLVCFKKS